MTNITQELLYGKRPIQRNNPQQGQTQWYYLDPRGADSVSDMRQIDVPDQNTPNPYAQEIQNYLYRNDRENYNDLYGNTQPSMQKNLQTRDISFNVKNKKNCFMNFDGNNLNLYRNSTKIDTLDAQAGHDDFQSAKYQNIPDKGPLPEGRYYVNQNERQNITFPDALIGTLTGILGINRGTWKGGPAAWGLRRVWLKPDTNTNTYGRSGFTIHGGWSKGSAGCIDIPWQTHRLRDYLDSCQTSIPLDVKYPENW